MPQVAVVRAKTRCVPLTHGLVGRNGAAGLATIGQIDPICVSFGRSVTEPTGLEKAENAAGQGSNRRACQQHAPGRPSPYGLDPYGNWLNPRSGWSTVRRDRRR